MPSPTKLRFRFASPDANYACELDCQRCAATSRSGTRCKNRVCIGLGMCWAHTRSQLHLQVRDSTLPGAGKGLFAHGRGDEIVFRTGDVVCRYNGRVVSRADYDSQYGSNTGPYGLLRTAATVEDAACARGIGAIANHATHSNVRYSRAHAGHMQLIATRNIRAGAEIFVNYGRDYRFGEDTQHDTARR